METETKLKDLTVEEFNTLISDTVGRVWKI